LQQTKQTVEQFSFGETDSTKNRRISEVTVFCKNQIRILFYQCNYFSTLHNLIVKIYLYEFCLGAEIGLNLEKKSQVEFY
jgi:hypothetical protein